MSGSELGPAQGAGGEQRLFCIALCCAAGALLGLIADQTKWIDGLRLAAQPRMLPLVTLIGTVVFAGIASAVSSGGPVRSSQLLAWLRPIEYVLYFMLYAGSVRIVGYGPATVLFCALLAARAGCTRRQVFAAGAAALVIAAVFKGMLAVRIPGATWYEQLPGPLANFLILNF